MLTFEELQKLMLEMMETAKIKDTTPNRIVVTELMKEFITNSEPPSMEKAGLIARMSVELYSLRHR